MSSRGWRERIQDILDAIAEIEAFTEGMDFETFHHDQKTVRAVEMNFIIIGEAAASVPTETMEEYPVWSKKPIRPGVRGYAALR
jgi:uncharacterized protein with HEPN domain